MNTCHTNTILPFCMFVLITSPRMRIIQQWKPVVLGVWCVEFKLYYNPVQILNSTLRINKIGGIDSYDFTCLVFASNEVISKNIINVLTNSWNMIFKAFLDHLLMSAWFKKNTVRQMVYVIEINFVLFQWSSYPFFMQCAAERERRCKASSLVL